MDSRALAALLCSLISQLILLLLLSPLLPFSSSPLHHLPLLHLFLSSDATLVATALFTLPPRKRRRPDQNDFNNPVKYRTLELSEKDSGPNNRVKYGEEPWKGAEEEDEEEEDNNPDNLVEYRVIMNPDSFPVHFRMTSSSFHYLSGLLEPLLDCRDPGPSPLGLSPEFRLAIGLLRLATGSSYSETAAFFRVSEPVARFCTKQLCRVLCTNFRFWVGFPAEDELVKVSKGFEERTGLPNCCGVIVCTRFRIGGDDVIGTRSVATQIVVDSECRILSIVAGFDGNKDDWSILKSSSLCKDINDGKLLDSSRVEQVDGVDVTIPQYFVGVSREYPLLPWLQVPFPDPTTPGSHEEDFNTCCKLIRGLTRRTVASLKNWGVLNKPIEGECRNAVAYIGACAILHNALLMREDLSALIGDGSWVEDNDNDDDRVLRGHHALRETGRSEQEKQGSEIRSALAAKARHFRILRETES